MTVKYHRQPYTAPCPDGHDAEWVGTSDTEPTYSCRTCDPPEPASYRWLRDVDTQRRRA